MRHWRIGLILIALHLFLGVLPCSGGVPTPGGGMPDVQFTPPSDIVLPPIVYTGPVLDDIGMKLISYSGPDLSDITMAPIHFSKAPLVVTPAATLSRDSVKAGNALTLPAAPIPGSSPGIKILSPLPGQKVMGSVLLEVKITGWQGTPGVDLKWWWSAATPAGQWPATPQSMSVVSSLKGKTRIYIPASAFPKYGRWRVEAAVKVSDSLTVSDDVSFNLAGIAKTPAKTVIMKQTPKQTPKQTLPDSTAPKPAAGKRIQLRPVAPSLKDTGR
jgi:hypothetical protein